MDTRRAPGKLDADALWDYALRILAQRPKSSSEIRQKLSRRADSPASMKTVLDKLREYGLIDDLKFSEAFATSRLQNRGFGPMRVMRDLRAKRVASSVAQTAIDKTFAGVDETELARQFIQRKYRGKDPAALFSDRNQLASAYGRLRVAGFSSSASVAALKYFSRSAAELEDLPPEE
jgi:regulatory protein